jgi:hypothetical protein
MNFSHDFEHSVGVGNEKLCRRLFIKISIASRKAKKLFHGGWIFHSGEFSMAKVNESWRHGKFDQSHSPHQLEANTQMISKVEVVQHVNDVVRSVGVLFAEFVENANFDQCLMMEALFVANDFDCDVLIGLVVQSTNHLSKASLTNHLENLVAIANVIVNHLEKRKEEKQEKS